MTRIRNVPAKGRLLVFWHPQTWQSRARTDSPQPPEGGQSGGKWYVHPGGDALQQEVHAA